jgi:hypothetical protein
LIKTIWISTTSNNQAIKLEKEWGAEYRAPLFLKR